MWKFILFLSISVLLIGCSTVRESTATETTTKVDTIFVINPAWEDSVRAFWEDSLTVTGVFIDSLKKDTILIVQYKPAQTKFIVKKFQDTVYTTRIDTITVSNITTITKEPTFLEEWWWLILIVAVIILIFLIKIK